MERILLDSWSDACGDAFDALFASGPLYMQSMDGSGRIERVSDYWAEALGRPPQSLVGEDWTSLLTPQSAEKAKAVVPVYLDREGAIGGTEFEFLRADGQVLPVVMSAKAQRDDDGKVAKVLAVLYDNSEARANRAALEAAIAEAEEANRAKSRFLAAMSHEIRTPMNAILGFAQLLKLSDLDDKRRAHVDAIQSAGATLMNLLTDLLDLSQIEAGQMRIDEAGFDLDGFVDQLAEWWQTGAAEKGLRLRITKDQGLPKRIVSDRGRIQQVLNNYLGNAVKFTQEGRITLGIEEIDREGDRLRIRFEVSDTGPGLSAEQVDQLFKPFVQVGADCSNARGGWGLGLSICHEIATAMGGRVGVHSRPGAGATFFFEIDVAAEQPETAAAEDATATTETPAELEVPAGAGLDILVAEDNDMSRAMLREMLTELGHRVAVAEDGLKAVEALRETEFDLVFMDVMMPHLDGISAMRRIRRSIAPARRIPIIACSAHTTDHESYRRAGMDDFLPKPVDRTRLQAMLRRYGTARGRRMGPEPGKV